MEIINQTMWVAEFILIGLSENAKIQLFLFAFFLLTYAIILLGNSLMVITITLSSNLHSPMYFFLCFLSIVDICYTSSTVPKLLLDFLSEVKHISFFGCVAQLYCFICFGGIECVLLAVMAGDRYVAICMPLHYRDIMSLKVCMIMATICSLIGMLNSLTHTAFIFRLSFCKSRIINHFICDLPPLLAISCTDTSVNELVVYTAGGLAVLGTFGLIMISYIFIIKEILKIKTLSGRLKAFSTCTSHLTVVTLFYGTSMFTYFRPTTNYSLNKDRVITVIYGIMTPMFNPVIYSFRNNEVQEAIKKLIYRRIQPYTSH